MSRIGCAGVGCGWAVGFGGLVDIFLTVVGWRLWLWWLWLPWLWWRGVEAVVVVVVVTVAVVAWGVAA